jgi:RNA polymerase sigma-70 factor, ECF subfamily
MSLRDGSDFREHFAWNRPLERDPPGDDNRRAPAGVLGVKGREHLDESTIRGFIHEDYARLVGAVTLVSGSRALAEDAVQEAMVRAWERSNRGEQIESLPRWIAAVALNLSRSAVRRRLVERKTHDRIRAEPIAGPEPDRIDVARAVRALPRRQREVVVLRYLLDMNTNEAATCLGVSEGTIKSTLSRARAALSGALGTPDLEVTNDATPR